MLKPRILPLPALLLALLLVPLLTACGPERVRIATPPIEWTAPVAVPVVPAGEALCDGVPCLSDRETGALIADLVAALDAANGRLLKLRDWVAGVR